MLVTLRDRSAFIQTNNQLNEHSPSYTNWTQASSQSLLIKRWTPGGIQATHSQTHKYICITRTIKLLVISQQASHWVVSAKWLFELCGRENHRNSWHSALHRTCPLVWSELRGAGLLHLLSMGAERQARSGDCGIDNRLEQVVRASKKMRNVWLYANVTFHIRKATFQVRKANSLSPWGEGRHLS